MSKVAVTGGMNPIWKQCKICINKLWNYINSLQQLFPVNFWRHTTSIKIAAGIQGQRPSFQAGRTAQLQPPRSRSSRNLPMFFLSFLSERVLNFPGHYLRPDLTEAVASSGRQRSLMNDSRYHRSTVPTSSVSIKARWRNWIRGQIIRGLEGDVAPSLLEWLTPTLHVSSAPSLSSPLLQGKTKHSPVSSSWGPPSPSTAMRLQRCWGHT